MEKKDIVKIFEKLDEIEHIDFCFKDHTASRLQGDEAKEWAKAVYQLASMVIETEFKEPQ